ncbi:class A beta-lactamase-related serine hydrolase [Kangiella sp. HD9-110m-PIT-SAG07]|nr:class A beta-lactamase-related serine hydrolase [Kangiella sp. HD9-110m-PIT-SAG07]
MFRTASLSKIFTAQAIMQLVEREEISLDDKVAQYLPQFDDSPITIRHLLTHSSGLSDQVGPLPIDKMRSLKSYLSHLSEQAVNVKPGNSFEYSDGGFNILGAIVSVVSDMRFEDYITKNILLPTDMRHSGYFDGKQGIKAEALPTYEGEFLNKDQLRPYDVAFYPSEGLVSNVADLSRWLVSTLTLSEKVLTKDSYRSMLQPQLKTTWGEIYMGLGWQVYEKNGQSVARHPGSIRGYKALIISFPESQDAMILLSNAHETPRWDIARVIREILTEQKVW